MESVIIWGFFFTYKLNFNLLRCVLQLFRMLSIEINSSIVLTSFLMYDIIRMGKKRIGLGLMKKKNPLTTQNIKNLCKMFQNGYAS